MADAPPTPIGHRPVAAELDAARVLLAPWRWLTAPRLSGLEHVPTDRPILLAGNHTLMGVLDSPLLVLELWERLGLVLRPLGDHIHFQVPGWRALLERFGVVDGTRENVRALMAAGESLVVFPGGGREVFKHKGEQYRLLWGNRTGFARLAIESGYPIVPFAAVGADDVFDILFDADDLRASPFGPLVDRLAPRPDLIPPAVRGVGPTAVPRPERFYFHFAPPVETRDLAGRADDPEVCLAVRERVREAVEAGIAHLLLERERDPERALLPRVIGRLQRRRRDGD
jgi:1-acyl-sn-glycerol-3-phosphate acyltransferase